MSVRAYKIWRRLIDLGWSQIEPDLLALGNLTFSVEYDDIDSPGGALIRQFAAPWRPFEEDQPELVGRFPIWLNHPRPIRKAIGKLSIQAVLIQVNQAVLMAGCDIFQQTPEEAEEAALDASN